MTSMRSLPVQFRARQSGVVLFIALIFLVLLTVMALTTFTVSKGSQQIVGNMTSRNQTFQVATQISETAISTTRLVDQPTLVLLDPGTGVYGRTATIDINGDTKTVINAVVQLPTCNSANQVAGLNLILPKDLGCATNPPFYCYDVVFQFKTTADDPVTNAHSEVTQGAAVRAQPASAHNICQGPGGLQYF